MRYYSGAIAAVKSAIFVVVIGALLVGGAPLAYGMDNVEVMVCPAADQSSFAVTMPQSDSIVSDSKLPVSGDVKFISQIDFFIDDVYNHTIALGYSETQFSSDLSLAPGTHTISFVASDSCSQTIHEGSLVVTYEPKTQSSVGENVETVVGGQVTNIPVVATPVAEQNGDSHAIERFYFTPYRSVTETLDIVNPVDNADPAVTSANVARSVLFVAGTVLTLAAVYVGTLSASALSGSFSAILPFQRRAAAASVVVGLVLIALVFML